MIVSADEQTHITRPSCRVGHVVPIVDIAFGHGVMGNNNGRFVGRCGQLLFKIIYVKGRYMSVGHTHEWSGVETYKCHAFVLKSLRFGTENLLKGRATRLAPRGLMVAKIDIIGYFELLQTILHLPHHEAVALLGQVTGYEHEVKARCFVHLGYALHEIVCGTVTAGIEMDVGKLCKPKRGYACPSDGQRPAAKEQDGYFLKIFHREPNSS